MTGLRAAGEPTRLRILSLLARGERSVKDLTDILGQSQPRISRHLKLLGDAGLVERHPEGTWAFFRLAESGAGGRLVSELLAMSDPHDPILRRDLERLEAVREAHAALAARYFSANAAKWDEIRSLQAPEKEVEARIEALIPRGLDLLVDLGTGTARMLELLADRYRRGVGIDLSQDMLHYARSRLDSAGVRHAQLRQGDVYNPQVDTGSADAVILHQVLHFLDNPALAVREAARLLKPGGLAVIVDLAPHDMEQLRENHAHRRLGFNPEQINGWLEEAGITPGEMWDIGSGEPGKLTVTIWSGRAAAASDAIAAA
ncbi:MAG: ArsR/SmtB family transcription factor [Flavobacteriaceae bacterium]